MFLNFWQSSFTITDKRARVWHSRKKITPGSKKEPTENTSETTNNSLNLSLH